MVNTVWASSTPEQVKNPPAMQEDTEGAGSILGLGRYPGGGEWQVTPVFLP